MNSRIRSRRLGSGTRIKRVALSRKSLFEERMGYLEGGSEVLLEVVAERIRAMGGEIVLNAQVERVNVDGGKVTGLTVGGQTHAFDQVVSTIPLPYLTRLAPDLPADERESIAAVHRGVVCVLLKPRKPFTENFWLNINDPRIEIPGLIEYSNLNPLDGKSNVVLPAVLYAADAPQIRKGPANLYRRNARSHDVDPPRFLLADVVSFCPPFSNTRRRSADLTHCLRCRVRSKASSWLTPRTTIPRTARFARAWR